jgi:hypothetical protein
MVEFDIMRFGESTPAGETHLTVWGIGPKDMQQARQNLYGKRIQIFAGMSKGLPLAGVWDKKLAIEGTIFRCSATGRAQSYGLTSSLLLDQLTPRPRADGPLQVTMPWSMGQKLSVALTQCVMTMGALHRT